MSGLSAPRRSLERRELVEAITAEVDALTFGLPALDEDTNAERVVFLEEQLELPPAERAQIVTDSGLQDWEEEARAVIGYGGDVAALVISRHPDDPDAVTEGIEAAAYVWEQRAGRLATSSPVLATRSPTVATRAAQLGGTTSLLASQVRELDADQDETHVEEHVREHGSAAAAVIQQVQRLHQQVDDLANTIGPAPQTGPRLYT